MTDDEIESLLRAEIRWAVDEGPGWDPDHGTKYSPMDQRWITSDSGCGICAVGALLVHRQPCPVSKAPEWLSELATAGAILGRSTGWVETLYYAVSEPVDGHDIEYPTAADMGHRLRTYGDVYASASREARLREGPPAAHGPEPVYAMPPDDEPWPEAFLCQLCGALKGTDEHWAGWCRVMAL